MAAKDYRNDVGDWAKMRPHALYGARAYCPVTYSTITYTCARALEGTDIAISCSHCGKTLKRDK